MPAPVRTLAEPVVGTEVRVEPKETAGIEINGIPADLDHVAKADVRVDLVASPTAPQPEMARAFVVEHVLGPLGLHGVTAASVEGCVDTWEFARPEHRFCYSSNRGPTSVVGHPAGLPNPTLAQRVREVGVVGSTARRTTVSDPVTVEANGGELTLRPREYGAGIRFETTYDDASLTVEVDPQGKNDPGLVDRVTTSTTPYLAPSSAEAVTHSIADLVSDVAVIGGFDDLVVEANLGEAYHVLTVGAARKAHEEGVVVARTA